MSDVRTAVEQAVTELVDEHVPRMWRRQALAWLPVIVARVTAAVEAVREVSRVD